MDVVAFSFQRTEDGNKVNFISGIVKPYGIQAIANNLAPNDAVNLAYSIYKSTVKIDVRFKPFKEKIYNLIRKLIIDVSKIDTEFFNKYQRDMFNSDLGIMIHGRSDMLMPIFAGGGGCISEFYINTINESHEKASLYKWFVPTFKIQEVPPPSKESLELLGNKFFRFTIAYGLSFPKWERPEIVLPSKNISNINTQENTERSIRSHPDYYE